MLVEGSRWSAQPLLRNASSAPATSAWLLDAPGAVGLAIDRANGSLLWERVAPPNTRLTPIAVT